jgi:hypothetical protein
MGKKLTGKKFVLWQSLSSITYFLLDAKALLCDHNTYKEIAVHGISFILIQAPSQIDT